MKPSTTLLYISFFFSISFARPQDSPNDDSDDALPSCAAACSNALSSSALAAGSNSNDLWANACQNSGILNAFESCYKGTQCSDDDMDGAHDWIRSTCAVVRKTASATHTTSPATTTDSTSATTTGSTGSSTTATVTSSTTSSTATATATNTPDTGLSTGAKVGIGIGVALGVLLLIAAIIAFCINRMRKSRRDSQALWPDNVNGWQQLHPEAGTAAMAERGRYEPTDPYSAWTPLPRQPELGGLALAATDRHELHGQAYAPRDRASGAGLPASLAIGGGAAAANGLRYVSELDGTAITPTALPRKPVGSLRSSQQTVSDSSQRELLGACDAPERPVSAISDVSDDEDEDEDGSLNAVHIPLPRSPISPTSPTRRV